MGLFLMEARPLRGLSRARLPSDLSSEQDVVLFRVLKGVHGTEDAGWKAGLFNRQWAAQTLWRLQGTVDWKRHAAQQDMLLD